LAGLLLATAVGTAMPQASTTTKPSDPGPVAPAVPIIVGTPATLDELLGRINSPDFVLLRGDRYREFLKAQEKDPAVAAEPIVESVAIRGRVDRLAADLEVDFRVS